MIEKTARMSLHAHPRRPRPADVLLVDDDPACLEALSGTLHNRLGHFTLDTCETGIQAMTYVTAKHYDTIITDVNMPGMNGLEFLTRVRQLRPCTPIVVISGYGNHAVVSKAIDAGAADFIAKPIERDVFMRTVRQTLNVSRLRSLSERRLAIISRAREHYRGLAEKLGHSNDQWRGWLEPTLSRDSASPPDGALLQQKPTEPQIDIFSKRAHPPSVPPRRLSCEGVARSSPGVSRAQCG